MNPPALSVSSKFRWPQSVHLSSKLLFFPYKSRREWSLVSQQNCQLKNLKITIIFRAYWNKPRKITRYSSFLARQKSFTSTILARPQAQFEKKGQNRRFNQVACVQHDSCVWVKSHVIPLFQLTAWSWYVERWSNKGIIKDLFHWNANGLTPESVLKTKTHAVVPVQLTTGSWYLDLWMSKMKS